MSTTKNKAILGDYYGTIDAVVLSKWNDIDVMKSRPGKRKKTTTSVKLQQHNTVFGMISNFLQSATSLINVGYQKPKLVKNTPFNAAVSYHLENAVIGGPEAPAMEMSKVLLTFPIRKTQSAWNPVLSSTVGNKVSITWELNPFPHKTTQLDDKVTLVFYDTTFKEFRSFTDIVERFDLSYTHVFHKSYTGHEIHWYLFLVSADGKLVSESEYLGKVTITA